MTVACSAIAVVYIVELLFIGTGKFWVSEEVFCMLVLKGSEAAARIKKEVQEMVEGLGGHVPTGGHRSGRREAGRSVV